MAMVTFSTISPSTEQLLKKSGTYDFHENFEYVKPWLKQADLVIGDFEWNGEQGPLFGRLSSL